MAKTRPPYPPEFRRRMVELVRAGRNPEELGREFEPSGHLRRMPHGLAGWPAGLIFAWVVDMMTFPRVPKWWNLVDTPS